MLTPSSRVANHTYIVVALAKDVNKKVVLTTAPCKLVTMAAVESNPMQSTKIPDPTLETKRPAPLNDDQSPAMIPCIAGSSGYPALLKNKI